MAQLSATWRRGDAKALGMPSVPRPYLGEDGQKPLTDWIQENGRRVDPALWRSAAPDLDSGGRPAEVVGAQLYDLHRAAAGG